MSDNGSSRLETIDDKLFLPLSQFFIVKSPSCEEFTQYLLSTNGLEPSFVDRGHYRGFLFEVYVKILLPNFAETRNDFNETRFARMIAGRPHQFSYTRKGRQIEG